MGRMGLLLGFIAIALIVVAWYSRVSAARQTWLESLELSGTWTQDAPPDGQDPMMISFSGELSKGSYELRRNNIAKQGTWRISQSSLILSDTNGDEVKYEIRLFEQGRVGLDGDDLERQTFSKQADNIVPLRRS